MLNFLTTSTSWPASSALSLMARRMTQGTPFLAAIWLTAAPSISTQSGCTFSAMAALVAESPTNWSPVAMVPAMAFTPSSSQASRAAFTSSGSPS